jgi:phage-related protein
MATFPDYKPVYSVSKNSKPNVRVVRFNGYEQRVTFGLNQNPKSYSVDFSLSDAEADEIETFLDARAADAAAFTWTPPDTATSGNYVCGGWTRTMFDFQRSKISATFRQTFSP